MPLGIEAGLLGSLISIELGFSGFVGFALAILISIIFAFIFGWAYGAVFK